MNAYRCALVFILSLALAGCGSSWREFAYKAHADYEQQLLHRSPRPPAADLVASSSIKPSSRRSKRNRVNAFHERHRTSGRIEESPRIGTPEWDRAEAFKARREREMNRVVRSICQPC